MTIKECVICGLQFDAKANAKTCSTECSCSYRKQREAKYRNSNREHIKERKAKYRLENHEARVEYDRQYHKANRERRSEKAIKYRLENHEARLEYDRQYHKANRERQLQRFRAYNNSQSAAASMLEACAAMIQIKERGIHDETE